MTRQRFTNERRVGTEARRDRLASGNDGSAGSGATGRAHAAPFHGQSNEHITDPAKPPRKR